MSKPAYYNEINEFAAKWLRNLIAAGHLPAGFVDTRSIEDVQPDDLREFAQCHFFAGIGVWPYALRRIGWPDDRPIWSGSCPCQPFSPAGEGGGFADERHLWPHWFHLVTQRRPAKIVGEQVASKDAEPWLDLVQNDLEGMGYAFGAIPFPSAGVGAPHIRDRLYWMGDADEPRPQGHTGDGGAAGRQGPSGPVTAASISDRLADADSQNQSGWGIPRPGEGIGPRAGAARERLEGLCETDGREPGPTNGYWSAADWLSCRDGKWRPVEPGTSPLAAGLAARMGDLSPGQQGVAALAGLDAASLKRAKDYRVGSLHGYGNAINAEAAIAFLQAAL